jgi:hypothetical protein
MLTAIPASARSKAQLIRKHSQGDMSYASAATG